MATLGVWPHATGDDALRLCEELGPAMVAALAARRGPHPMADSAADAGWHARALRAEEELGHIRRSRGWRWLTRLYAILHVLKGRSGGGSAA